MPSLRERMSMRSLLDFGINREAIDPPDDLEGLTTTIRRPRSAVNGSQTPSQSDARPRESLRPSTAYARPPIPSRRRFSLLRRSEPDLFSRYIVDGGNSEDSSEEACPVPIIGVTSPTRDSKEESNGRRLAPFASKKNTFRSISYNAPTDRPAESRSTSSRRMSFGVRRPSVGRNGARSGPVRGAHSLAPSPIPNGLESPASSRPSEDQTGGSSATSESRSLSGKIFKLPRRKKKQPQSLFPLPQHLSPLNRGAQESARQDATIFPVQPSRTHSSNSIAPASEAVKDGGPYGDSRPQTPSLSRSVSYNFDGDASANTVSTAPALVRHSSTNSVPVEHSLTPPSAFPSRFPRGRSDTETSYSSHREDDRAPTPFHESVARTSMTSTTLGRNSIAHLRSLTSRFRNPSEIQSPRYSSPGGLVSKKNSFALSKEALHVPDREEGESAAHYYARLERDIPKKGIALLFSKADDPFSHDVLRSLLRTFIFFEEPLDISLRKFLWEIDLPGEAQQIDRVISAFSGRYFECNGVIFNNLDETYFTAYSLIILHSDLFNRSNKRKMQRPEYQKNTAGSGLDEEILGYFYDNIQYTEFVQQQQDDDDSIGKAKKGKARRKVRKIKVSANENGGTGKVDPYDFILDEEQTLEVLRPALRGVMNLDPRFNFTGTMDSFDVRPARSAFARSCILQTISNRSRPEAFSSAMTLEDHNGGGPGIVEIKVAKVGILLRKDPKKKTARSPWQEWGVMLTQSQIHFFRNRDWIRDLMKQAESYRRSKQPDVPQKQGRFQGVIFRPQIQDFKPDHSIRTSSALALRDMDYDKHKHGFLLVNVDAFGSDETVRAESETEMNDWILKIDYAAAFAGAKIDMQAPLNPTKTPLIRLVSSPQLGASGEVMDPQAGSTQQLDVKPMPTTPEAIEMNVARDQAICTRLESLDEEIKEAERRLNETLRTARHLQILAPFPPRTRNELLVYGARVARKVRRTRFEVWRLVVQAAMLKADHDAGDLTNDQKLGPKRSILGRNASPKLLPSALSRLNSKASGILNSPRGPRSGSTAQRPGTHSRLAPSPGSDLAGGMDQAFATPADTLNRSETFGEGPWRLPPLTLGVEFSPTEGDRPGSSSTESAARFSSITNGLHSVQIDAVVTPNSSELNNMEEATIASTESRPITSAESEKERNDIFGSPPGRISNRRSLQRQTLRETRDTISQARMRRGKESVSSTGNDDSSSLHESETLPRGPGSFTLHGKKASVITLGQEFQSMTPEERLKARKQALALETREQFPEVDENDTTLIPTSTSDARSEISAVSDEAFRTAPLAVTDADWGQEMDSSSHAEAESKRRSSSTAVGGAEVEDEGMLMHGTASSRHLSKASTTYFDADAFPGESSGEDADMLAQSPASE